MTSYTKNKDNYCIDIVDKYSVDIYVGTDYMDGSGYDYKNIVRKHILDNKLYNYNGTGNQQYYYKYPNRIVKIKKTDNEEELTKEVNDELGKWINSDMLSMPKKDIAYICVYYFDDLKYVYVINNFLNKKKKEIKKYNAKEFFIANGRSEEEINEEEKRLAICGIRKRKDNFKFCILIAFILLLYLIGFTTLIPLAMGASMQTGPISFISREILKLVEKTYPPISEEQIYGAISYDIIISVLSYLGIRGSIKDMIESTREKNYYSDKVNNLETDPEKIKVMKKNFNEYLKNEKRFDNEKETDEFDS